MKKQRTKKRTRIIRLLIVDDSKVMRHTLKLFCASIPRVVVIGEANNGLEALSAIRALKPDVITLDIRMPMMNGIEVLQAMNHEQLEGAVIVLSAIGGDPYRQKCFELGASYVLDKTTELEKLSRILSDLIL